MLSLYRFSKKRVFFSAIHLSDRRGTDHANELAIHAGIVDVRDADAHAAVCCQGDANPMLRYNTSPQSASNTD